jgi:hypothetical protein
MGRKKKRVEEFRAVGVLHGGRTPSLTLRRGGVGEACEVGVLQGGKTPSLGGGCSGWGQRCGGKRDLDLAGSLEGRLPMFGEGVVLRVGGVGSI